MELPLNKQETPGEITPKPNPCLQGYHSLPPSFDDVHGPQNHELFTTTSAMTPRLCSFVVHLALDSSLVGIGRWKHTTGNACGSRLVCILGRSAVQKVTRLRPRSCMARDARGTGGACVSFQRQEKRETRKSKAARRRETGDGARDGFLRVGKRNMSLAERRDRRVASLQQALQVECY
jgi:hypothetical protein